jgi:uncharacterized membrane protein YbhN (UPF0104 family)
VQRTRAQVVFFIVGVSIFAYLVAQFGVDEIVVHIRRAGWTLVYIVGIWFIVYTLNTIAWRLLLGNATSGVPLHQMFFVTVSGFVINYITPFLALGGEPYRVTALSNRLGVQQSVSAVVLYRMVHTLGHMLVLLMVIVAALIAIPLSPSIVLILIVSAAVLSAVIGLVLLGHRGGVFQRLFRFASRFRMLKTLAGYLAAHEGDLRRMDEIFTDAFRHRPIQFSGAVSFEFLARLLMALEVYLILQGAGVDISLFMAAFLYLVQSLVINLLFFVPLNIGAREGSLYLGMQTLALAPLMGVYVSVVMRIREFVWILIGLALVLATKSRPKHTT